MLNSPVLYTRIQNLNASENLYVIYSEMHLPHKMNYIYIFFTKDWTVHILLLDITKNQSKLSAQMMFCKTVLKDPKETSRWTHWEASPLQYNSVSLSVLTRKMTRIIFKVKIVSIMTTESKWAAPLQGFPGTKKVLNRY